MSVQTVEGVVKNGVIVPDQPVPDGMRVTIVLANAEQPQKPTLTGLLKFAGAIDDLPADFAEQHDHYIHGTPKR